MKNNKDTFNSKLSLFSSFALILFCVGLTFLVIFMPTVQKQTIYLNPDPNKNYLELSLKDKQFNQKEIIEFFSFYCPHCQSFEYEYNIPKYIKSNLPEGYKFTQYHVNFLGSDAHNYTLLWSIALLKNKTEEFKPLLYKAANNNVIFSKNEDIKNFVVNNNLLSEKEFDDIIISKDLHDMIKKQEELSFLFSVNKTPSVFVGKYYINSLKFHNTKKGDLKDKYLSTIKEIVSLIENQNKKSN